MVLADSADKLLNIQRASLENSAAAMLALAQLHSETIQSLRTILAQNPNTRIDALLVEMTSKLARFERVAASAADPERGLAGGTLQQTQAECQVLQDECCLTFDQVHGEHQDPEYLQRPVPAEHW